MKSDYISDIEPLSCSLPACGNCPQVETCPYAGNGYDPEYMQAGGSTEITGAGEQARQLFQELYFFRVNTYE